MSIVKDINVLRKVSKDVVSVDEATSLISKIEKELLNLKGVGVGLSAIQIGIPKKVAVIRYKNHSLNLINSSVLDKQGEFVFFNEGCLSFPNRYISTKRYQETTIENWVIDNGVFRKETQLFHYDEDGQYGDGLVAIAVQHEIDHFLGKIFYDVECEKKSTTVFLEQKVGRNNPCICGSGKKFKKCCLGKN